jgi:hypothetical protein
MAHEAVLHVGPHKTGSSTIQWLLLSRLRDVLEQRDRFEIPTNLPGPHSGLKEHANLYHAMRLANPREHEAWKVLEATARNASTDGKRLLLASENLSALTPRMTDFFMSALGQLGFNARVLIVFRCAPAVCCHSPALCAPRAHRRILLAL